MFVKITKINRFERVSAALNLLLAYFLKSV
jgi:hypothetical protein